MPNFLGKLKFNCRNFGISEVYPIVADSHPAAQAALIVVGVSRLNMILPDAVIVDATVSDTDIRGDSMVVEDLLEEAGTFTPGEGLKTYQPDDGALIRETDATFLLRGLRILRLVPNSQFDDNGSLIPGGDYLTSLDEFMDVLIDNVAIATRIPLAVAPPFYDFSGISTVVYERHGTRKAGRPFGLNLGRRVIR